jgi:hypothetical protein
MAPRPREEDSMAEKETLWDAYKGLFDVSLAKGRGLNFYINGQVVAGIVTRVIGKEGVAIRNREFSQIVLRLDRIDGVAGS